MTATPQWFERKACRPEHGTLFFPAGLTYDAGRVDYGPALAICRGCEAIDECRADAIAHGDIVDGYTTHGQVVGGCAPAAKPKRPGGTPPNRWETAKLMPCGTIAAYKRHIRHGEPTCEPCREAMRVQKESSRAAAS